jgi:thiol-disulfide isomerase/thioredoxin
MPFWDSRASFRPASLARIGMRAAIPAVVIWLVVTSYFGGQNGFTGVPAPEFQGIHKWLNSEPLTIAGLKGKVVLVDFWTYTCINCIRTFPYLADWNSRYAEDGLVTVGMHSPEFEFEKITANVAASARSAGLVYPIAQDNSFATWNAYGNRFWPAKYLVDKDGVIRYTHFGEGSYRATEEKIRYLLEEAGADLSGKPLGAPLVAAAGASQARRGSPRGMTPELYGGYDRNGLRSGGYIAHPQYYDGPERTLDYNDPGKHENDKIYLQGRWFNGLESLLHAGESAKPPIPCLQDPGPQDHLAIRFSAASVSAVVNPTVNEPFRVGVKLDGRPLTRQEAGRDIMIEGGQSFFTVDEGRLYNLVSLPRYSDHEFQLTPMSADFALFAFTFCG